VSPGSFVFCRGAQGREMFFVSTGVLDVISASGYIITQLKEGSYFGEHAILSDKVRVCASVAHC
jgi:CRP-like cAMP-binding protein